jgi:hypothetical protein
MPLKRVAALLSSLLLLQLTLLGSGVLCGPHRDGHAATSAPAMSMAHVADASRPMRSDGGCDAQPTLRCASMASCTIELAPTTISTTIAIATPVRHVSELVARPADRAVVPDVPPPRA